MRQLWGVIVFVGAAIWAVVAFLAANSPEDVAERTRSWAALPVVNALPNWLLSVLRTPSVMGLGFFVLGCLCGGYFARWRQGRGKLTATEVLASDVSLVAYSIDNMSHVYTNPAVIGRLNVILDKMRRSGFAMPPANGGQFERDRMSFYLHQVAAYLSEGDLESAKRIATAVVQEWPAHG